MEQRQIRYFLAIHEMGSISKAADTLFVTRQALSSAMKNLELELGAPLFERSKRGVELTEEGRVFKSYAEEIDRLYKDLLNDVRERTGKRDLKIGVPLLYTEDDTIKLIKSFERQSSAAKLVLENDENYTGFFERVERGELDVAWTRAPYQGTKLQCEEATSLGLKIIVSKNSVLSERKVVDFAEDLRGEVYLCTSRDTLQDLKPYADAVGLECRLVSPESSLLRTLVAEGEGFFVAAEGSESKMLSDRTVAIDFVNAPFKRGIYLVFKRNPSDAVLEFVRYFKENVAPSISQ